MVQPNYSMADDPSGGSYAGLFALLAVTGTESDRRRDRKPDFQNKTAAVFVFGRVSEAVSSALLALSSEPGTVAMVWLGEIDPIAAPFVDRALRVIECLSFGEPGQLLVSLAAAETVREHLPDTAKLLELGNRPISTGAIERLFVYQAASKPSAVGRPVVADAPRPIFLGRHRELSELQDRLVRYRLVTVTGPSGIGKSALVQRALHELQVEDSTWYLDASRLASPELLLPALNDLLGITKTPNQTHLQALALAAPLLDGVLALDGGTRDLAEMRLLVRELLALAPSLAIIVIAPRSMRLTGESVMALRGLDMPQGPEPWQLLREYDAMVVLEQAIVSAVGNFAIDGENADTLARICKMLDGNPAALALAAAKHRVLTPLQILHRLDHPLVFLEKPTDRGSRHDSLHRMLALTLEPLTDRAKSLCARLALLEGAFDFEDAERLFPEEALLSAYEELVDSGVIQPVSAGYHSRRFSMGHPTRQLASGYLTGQERELALDSRDSYFERLAEEAQVGLQGADFSAWMRRAEEQTGDIIATVRSLTRRRFGERATNMLCAWLIFWYERNFPRPGLALALEILTKCPQNPARARLENFAANMSLALGELDRAQKHALRARKFAQIDRRPQFEAFALATLASIASSNERIADAAQFLSESAVIHRMTGNRRLLYLVLQNVLPIYSDLSQFDDANAAAAEAYELEDEDTPKIQMAYFRNNHAFALKIQKNFEAAMVRVREALEFAKDIGSGTIVAKTIQTEAEICSLMGRCGDAAVLMAMAQRLKEHEDLQKPIARSSVYEATKRLIIETIGIDQFEERWREGRRVPIEDALQVAIRLTMGEYSTLI